MWYVIEGYDGQDVLARRQAARPEHLARLHALRDEGRLLLAGPCPAIDAEDPGPAGFSGSLVVARVRFAGGRPRLGRCRPLLRRRRVRAGRRASVPQGAAVSGGWSEADIPRLNPARVERIRALLTQALSPLSLEVTDDSHKHAGHAGARDGQGHFGVDIVSAAFAGKLPLARHRLVYAALGGMMQTDIHALAIRARTPDEAA